MIDGIDDIIKLEKQIGPVQSKERETVYVIHKHDKLNNILFDFKKAGYTPSVDTCGTENIIKIIAEFDNRIYIIKTTTLAN